MKTNLFAALMGIAIVATGCIGTVNERHTTGNPFVKDKMEGRYERSADQVYEAAKQVVIFNGTLLNESTLHNNTNSVRTIQGKVNQRTVWVRVEAIDPKPVTSVIVQARTKSGGSDLNLVHELEKQIALKLAR